MARKKAVEEKENNANNKEQSEKERVLNLALTQIQKEFGEGSIMKLGENQKMNIKSISTGSINLDIALGFLFFDNIAFFAKTKSKFSGLSL